MNKKHTNIAVWVLQILLALYNLTGGLYSYSNYRDLIAPSVRTLPPAVFMALSALQVLTALGLVIPGIIKKWRQLIPMSAAYLAINSLLGCVLYSSYVGFPGMLWGIVPAALAAYVAYDRRNLRG